jgi:hypothetical protein
MLSPLRNRGERNYASGMQISDNALDELSTLYQAEFGKGISREDALEMATRLVNLYEIIYRPLPHELDSAMQPSGDRPARSDASSPNAE